MAYISDAQFFRDANKKPDEYSLHANGELKAEIETAKKISQEKEDQGKIEKLGPFAANYKQVVDAVADFKLKPEFSQDDIENKILLERRKVILGFLRQVLDDVQRYTSSVNSFNLVYNTRNEAKDGDEYSRNMKEVDNNRRVVHNRLISDLKILIRLINVNFNADFNSNFRFEAERKMPDRKSFSDEELRLSLQKREYIKFDKKNFLFEQLPEDPDGERNYIKDWSFSLYGDLTKLNDDLSEKLNKKDLD